MMRLRLLTICVLLSVTLLLLPGGVAAAEKYEIDPDNSHVIFQVHQYGVGITIGRFNEIEGSFFIDREEPRKSRVTVRVHSDSVDTGEKRRDMLIQSPTFLDAGDNPMITFTSKRVRRAGSGSYRVTGDLTVNGATREITTEVEKIGEGAGREGKPRIGWYTNFAIKRSNYGMEEMLDGRVGDDVRLTVSIQGFRPAV